MYNQREDDELYELWAAYDYKREAYGDPCPGCGQLRGGGDCGSCMAEDDYPIGEPVVMPAAPVAAVWDEDDILF